MSDMNVRQDVRGRFSAKTLAEKFFCKVVKGDGCWEWIGNHHKKGYGTLWHNGRQIRATHASWELHNSAIPVGVRVLHKCDNPPCARPDHLFLGSQADNMKDKMLKLRAGKKLTADIVRAIRAGVEFDLSTQVLADLYKVSTVTILNIARRRTWRHV